MAIQPVPDVEPVPTPLIQRGDRTTFSDRVDTFVTWLEGAPVDFKALGDNVLNNANETLTNAQAAAADADTASDAATAAVAAAAAATGTQIVSTSTSSVLIGNGDKAFVTQGGKQYLVGVPAIAVDLTDAANWVSGPIKSYSGTNLVITATSFGGGGTKSNWNISLSGVPGVAGSGILAGNATDAINEKRGADLVSSANPDVWSGGGNVLILTGTTTITGLPAAPQAGAKRTLIASAATPMTTGANFIISGGSIVLAAGDIVSIVAETTTRFRVTVERNDGTATKTNLLPGNFTLLTATGSFVATKSGLHTAQMIGPGGSGGAYAVVVPGGNAAGFAVASGGGAGGYSASTFFAAAAASFTFVRGAAGAARVATSTTSALSALVGANGGNSAFSGPGLSMTVAGGQGGKVGNAALTAPGGLSSATGGVGGVANASYGDTSTSGGNGGDTVILSGNIGAVSGQAASGGGAVNLFGGTSYSAGQAIINFPNTSTTHAGAATGGAGVGGASGQASSTAAGAGSIQAWSGGGGAGGASPNATGINGGTPTALGGIGITLYQIPPFNAVAPGQAYADAAATVLGAGSGGRAQGGYGGAFAGSGGAYSNSAAPATAGPAGFGGGGGGAVHIVTTGTATATSGAGGESFVLIQRPG